MTYEEDVKNAVGSLEYWYQQEYPFSKDWEKMPKAFPLVSEMVRNYYTESGHGPQPATSAQLVHEEFHEWVGESEAHFNGELHYDPARELEELADLIIVIHGYAMSRGWDMEEATLRKYKVNLNRMYQDNGEILRNEYGKIQKNPRSPKVDLGDLV